MAEERVLEKASVSTAMGARQVKVSGPDACLLLPTQPRFIVFDAVAKGSSSNALTSRAIAEHEMVARRLLLPVLGARCKVSSRLSLNALSATSSNSD